MKKKAFDLLVLFFVLFFSSCRDKNQENSIVVATYAGKYQESLDKFVIPALKRSNPELKVIYALGTDNDHNPKLAAEKFGKGSFDVVILSASSFYNNYQNEIIGDLDFSKLPNSNTLLDQFRLSYAVPQIFSPVTLAYNEKYVAPVPDSWSALWNPEYKGKVGIFAVSGSAPSNYWLLAATARNGGNIERDDWMDHFSGLLEFRELEPKYYPSQDALVAGLQSGEVWLSINYRARNALLTVPGSETLGDVLPKEGSYADWYGAAIPKNAQNPEGAYAFIDIMLSPDVQEGFAEYFGYSPTVNNVTLSPEVLKKIGVDEDEIKRVYNIPTSFFVELAPRFKERWLQEYLQ